MALLLWKNIWHHNFWTAWPTVKFEYSKFSFQSTWRLEKVSWTQKLPGVSEQNKIFRKSKKFKKTSISTLTFNFSLFGLLWVHKWLRFKFIGQNRYNLPYHMPELAKKSKFFNFYCFRVIFWEIWVKILKLQFLKKGHISNLMEYGKMTLDTCTFIPYRFQNGTYFLLIKRFRRSVNLYNITPGIRVWTINNRPIFKVRQHKTLTKRKKKSTILMPRFLRCLSLLFVATIFLTKWIQSLSERLHPNNPTSWWRHALHESTGQWTPPRWPIQSIAQQLSPSKWKSDINLIILWLPLFSDHWWRLECFTNVLKKEAPIVFGTSKCI